MSHLSKKSGKENFFVRESMQKNKGEGGEKEKKGASIREEN